MAEENFECGKCGESFGTERGLHIHQSQAHEEKNQNEGHALNSQEISIGLRPILLGVFALGIFVGLSTGLVFSQLTPQTAQQGETANLQVDNNNNQPDNNQQDSQDQPDISGSSTLEAMKDIAASVGLNEEEIGQCISNSDGEEISEDKSNINDVAGSLGTPTFFIGNSEIGYAEVTGAQPYSRMESTINSKLEEARSGDSSVGSDEYTLENITTEGEPVFGEESAPIQIIEYSDYGCPWCAEWHGVDAIPQRPIDEEDSFNKVMSNHVDTGEVEFVMKDYPVAQLHPEAETAHKAANCVLENNPDSFLEFSQQVFENRDSW